MEPFATSKKTGGGKHKEEKTKMTAATSFLEEKKNYTWGKKIVKTYSNFIAEGKALKIRKNRV